MSSDELRRDLLALLCPGEPSGLSALTAEDWKTLDAMAAEHRLQPLLHAAHQAEPAIPAEIRSRWKAAHRGWSLTALNQQGELADTIAMLEQAGFAPVALKGAWLSRYAYPAPGLRPLRDLDLLLTPETVIPAFERLQRAGYRLEEPGETSLEEALLTDKHLPVLVAPRSTRIELHHRLWEPDGRLDHATPESDEAAVRARAVRVGGVAYPATEDMLAHLIVHAVYSHRLDCGPLVLADVDYLIRGAAIDWPHFWARAAREGWREGARLVLALARHWRRTPGIELTSDAGPAPPGAILNAAPELLLQPLATRQSAGVIAAARSGRPGALALRLKGGRRTRDGASAVRDMSREGGFLGWAWNRLKRTLGQAAQPGVLAQSRDLAALSRWLDGGGATRK